MSSINITDAIFAQAAARPDAVAVIDGDRAVSYRAFCGAVVDLAEQFAANGWAEGDIVGVCLRSGAFSQLRTAVALALIGVPQTTLSPVDPPALLRARMLRMGVQALVCDHAELDDIGVAVFRPSSASPEPSGAGVRTGIRQNGGDRLWIVGESSGTTGEPKLIGVSHRVEDAHGQRQAPVLGYREGERFVNLTGLRFLTGIKRALRCLGEGGCVTFPPDGLDAEGLTRWIDSHEIGYLSCVPFHLHSLLGALKGGKQRLPKLRVLRVTGSALSPRLQEAVSRHLTPNIFVDYGLNEVSTIAVATPELLRSDPLVTGLPLPGVEIGVVDEEDRPLRQGESGRVRVRGLGIEPRYLAPTAMHHTSAVRGGWFYTGDIGRFDNDGRIFLLGRADDMMKYDGMLVGPVEIETALRLHPEVLDVAAFALPSPGHHEVPAVAVVSKEMIQLDALKQFAAERLGARAPLVYMRVASIPRNAMGKVLRRELVEKALAAAARSGRPGAAQ